MSSQLLANARDITVRFIMLETQGGGGPAPAKTEQRDPGSRTGSGIKGPTGVRRPRWKKGKRTQRENQKMAVLASGPFLSESKKRWLVSYKGKKKKRGRYLPDCLGENEWGQEGSAGLSATHGRETSDKRGRGPGTLQISKGIGRDTRGRGMPGLHRKLRCHLTWATPFLEKSGVTW